MKIELPPIAELIVTRPGTYAGKAKHLIPNTKHQEIWDAIYIKLYNDAGFKNPVRGDWYLNPAFGYFGLQFHPMAVSPHYFNIGIDFIADHKTQICTIGEGVLEYSGYGLFNGNYVMISHPDIVTEDGFVLYSLYMHLHSHEIRFTNYQKMLREISLNNYPTIPVAEDKVIGLMGSTGNPDQHTYTHLHLQLEFRHKDGRIVAIDPASILGIPNQENLTKDITNHEDFREFARNNPDLFVDCGVCLDQDSDV